MFGPAWKPVAACGLLFAMACGPSFQAVYEGDQKFEHCYALDDNPNTGLDVKGTCWREWMKGYTYGQTRDRVEYAAVRQRALSRVPAQPTDEAMMEAAPGQVVSKAGIATPAPTSAFAPPPKTLSDVDSSSSSSSATPPPPPAPSQSAAPAASVVFVAPRTTPAASNTPPPAADCQGQCEKGWASCRGKADASAEAACTKTYRVCMRACFK